MEGWGREERDVNPGHFVACNAMLAGEQHHDNAGRRRKLSDVAPML